MNARSRTPAAVGLSLCVVVLGLIAIVAGDGDRVGPAQEGDPLPPLDAGGGAAAVELAYRERADGVRLHVRGRIKSLLPESRDDDTRRFLLELEGGRALLVLHPSAPGPDLPLAVGDEVELSGDYAWTQRGGELRGTSLRHVAREPD